MNHLLSTIGSKQKSRNDFKKLMKKAKSSIHLLGIDSDLLFPDFEIQKTFGLILDFKKDDLNILKDLILKSASNNPNISSKDLKQEVINKGFDTQISKLMKKCRN